ncbi:MAG: methyl-accepting chemotaxis protein [Leptolyngbyaceae cyanobacterium]
MPRNWDNSDIQVLTQVASQLGQSLEQAQVFHQQQLAATLAQQLTAIVCQMQAALEETQLYRIAVDGVRQALTTDRVLLYWIDESTTGSFVAESLDEAWLSVRGAEMPDLTFIEPYLQPHQPDSLNQVEGIADIQQADFSETHQAQLRSLAVKASLVVPIVVAADRAGLLIAHQCSRTRVWDALEIDFIEQVATQLATASSQLRRRAASQALLAERHRSQETLQNQLNQLTNEVTRVSQGDLMMRAEGAAGKIGSLADVFNVIVANLHQLVVQVKRVTEQVTTVMLENDEAIETLSQDSLLQAEEVTRTLTSLVQMTQSIQRIAEQAQHAAVIARKASNKAETSGEAMDLTVQSILNLREVIGETAHKVKRLGESSQQISNVVALIHEIAVQTNLLAINAGIEAHRAGAAGKGFSIVAEEVGELASRAATATQEVERLVSAIQEETFEVVEAMGRSTEEVVIGTRLVQDAKYDLSRILEVSQQIDRLLQSISETTTSHASTSETVTQLMQDIIQLAECTSESSGQISESLHQTLDAVQTLQVAVRPFKTEG